LRITALIGAVEYLRLALIFIARGRNTT